MCYTLVVSCPPLPAPSSSPRGTGRPKFSEFSRETGSCPPSRFSMYRYMSTFYTNRSVHIHFSLGCDRVDSEQRKIDSSTLPSMGAPVWLIYFFLVNFRAPKLFETSFAVCLFPLRAIQWVLAVSDPLPKTPFAHSYGSICARTRVCAAG